MQGFGGGAPASEGQWEFGCGSLDVAVILQLFSKKYAFLGLS